MNAFRFAAKALGVNLKALEGVTHDKALEVVREQALEVMIPELRVLAYAIEEKNAYASCALHTLAERLEVLIELPNIPRAELFVDDFADCASRAR